MDGKSAALAVPVWQQHAVIAQEEVVEKTVEEIIGRPLASDISNSPRPPSPQRVR